MTDSKDAGLAWYIRLVPEGYISDPGPQPSTYALPIDFETVQPTFTTFGNSTYSIGANPDASTGANTSATVLTTVHGNETWAGLVRGLGRQVGLSARRTRSN